MSVVEKEKVVPMKKSKSSTGKKWTPEQHAKFSKTMREKFAAKKAAKKGTSIPLSMLPDRPQPSARSVRTESASAKWQLALEVVRLLQTILRAP